MMEEAKIIAAICEGADLYEELVRRYHVGLIIHCERLVGDRDEAEDLAQAAFVKTYIQLDKFNPTKARYSTWLYKIATNLAIDYLRKHKRTIVVDDIESISEAVAPDFATEQERQEIRQVVTRLTPPEYREAIEAYYWFGKSYQDIADEKQVPINTVRTWIRRAKLKLKEELS